MVSTPSLARELQGRGFKRLLRWSRGVDHELFSPKAQISLDLPRPIFLYAGRLAIEKNLDASYLSICLAQKSLSAMAQQEPRSKLNFLRRIFWV